MSGASPDLAHAEATAAAPFIDDLPPWQETFLARYTRNFKFGVLGTGMLCMLALWLTVGGGSAKIYKPKPRTLVEAADTERAAKSEKAVSEHAAEMAAKYGGNEAYAPQLNDIDDHSVKLVAAPDPGVTEDTSSGSLPRIAEDGRQPWQVYARPYNMADKRPRIAFIVTDLGLSRTSTDAAITRLPANVTLSFDAQSPVAAAWCGRARQVGHEVILQVPMEPFDYPRSDPGPNTLLTTLPVVDNLQRLQWSMRQGIGYVGLTTLSGSRFTTETNKISPILRAIQDRGLMFIDSRVGLHSAVMDLAHDTHMPAVAVSVRIDQNFTPEAIDAAFAQLEQQANQNGSAIGMAPSVPIVLDKLDAWSRQLAAHGIALAPVSAMRM